MADPKTAPAAPQLPGMIKMTTPKGASTYVPEDNYAEYLNKGFKDADLAAQEADPGLEGFEHVSARAQALMGGATLGLSNAASDLVGGAVGALSGYEGPRTTAPGIDAPVDERSDFVRGMQESQAERQALAEKLGPERYVWEITGGIGASALGAGPVALVEQLGQRAAANYLGKKALESAAGAAANTVGQKLVGRALGGAVEGALGGLAAGASENVPQIIENPIQAAQDVALTTTAGGVLGAGAGGLFGLIEGVGGKVAQRGRAAIEGVEQLDQFRSPVPAREAIDGLGAAEALNTQAAVPASQIRPVDRGVVGTFLDNADAHSGGFAESVEKGARQIVANGDRMAQIEGELDALAGVGAKRRFNDAQFKDGLLNDLVDDLDPEDALKYGDMQNARTAAQAELDELNLRLADSGRLVNEATEAQRAARTALDEADIPAFKPSKAARSRAKALGLEDLGDTDLPAAQQRVSDRIAELNTELGLPAETTPSEAIAALRQELAEMDEIGRSLTKRDVRRVRELKGQLREADKLAKDAAANTADLTARQAAAQQRIADSDAALAAFGQPRRLSRMEAESRKMFDETKKTVMSYADQHAVGSDEHKSALQFLARLQAHADNTKKSFVAGDPEGAYNAIDQGFKSAVADFVDRAKSKEALEFAKGVYDIPRSFLERGDVFGPEIAGAQARVNPKYSAGILATGDESVRALWGQGGKLDQATQWGPQARMRSGAVTGLLNQVGTSTGDSAELAAKRAWAAMNDSLSTRADAWAAGDPRAKALADEFASLAKQNIDILNRTAEKRFRSDAFEQTTRKMELGAGTAALIGALTSTPELAVPAIASRWLVGAVARQRSNIMGKTLKGVQKLVTGGTKIASAVTNPNVQRVVLTDMAREKTLQRSREMSDPRSPAFMSALRLADRLNQESPGLGNAALLHELQQAQYVQSHLPKPTQPQTPFSPAPRHTATEARRLDQVLLAVGTPAKTFDRILAGEASNEDLDAMRTLYPGQYQRMVGEIMAQVERRPESVKSHTTRMYLSRVVGQPLTPALATLGRQQARAQAATAGVEDTGKPQGEGANGSDGKTVRAKMGLDPNAMYGSRADRVMSGQ